MQHIIKFFKNKYAVLAIASIAVLSAGFSGNLQSATSANCPGTAPSAPVFNFWPLSYNPSSTCTDFPMIDGFNPSGSGRDARFALSQSEHDAGINANSGQTVTVGIYFHNGASDQIDRSLTTAHNVVISAAINGGSSTTHNISASLSASNAPTVNSSADGGDFIIHSPSAVTVDYVPGSAAICISQQHAIERNGSIAGLQSCGSTGQAVLLPVSDSVLTGGVSLNDLKACFPYSGTLYFKVMLNGGSVGSAALSINKEVQNVTTGTNFSSSVNASQGNNLNYRITVTNHGQITANNVSVTDTGAFGISFTSGQNPIAGPISLGNLTPGQSATINYSAVVNANSGTLPNTATATSSNAQTVQSTANVIVNSINPGNPTMSISKQVQNVSTGTNFSNSVNASQGNNLNYRITVTNNSNSVTVNNVFVTDSGAPGVSITGGQNPVNSGINVGSLGPNQSATINYSAVVNVNSGTLINTATATASNAQTVQASASVFVNNNVNQNASLNITKGVTNLTFGNNGFSGSTNAKVGDSLAYQIVVTNNSNTTVNNITITDNLPFGINFTAGSLSVSGAINNPIFGGNQFSNVFVSSLNSGQSVTVTFNATASQTGTFVNTATASASNAQTVQASASVFVNQNVSNGQLNITKQVRNITFGNNLQKSITAFTGDRVQFQIVVNNFSGQTLNNVRLSDSLPSGFNYAFGTTRLDGNTTTDINSGNGLFLGSMFSNQQHTITFEGTVTGSIGTSITNTAFASADNANSVQDSATITINAIQGANVNLILSKRAFNDTQNVDATSTFANKEDFITYSLTVQNTGNAAAQSYVFQDDLSGILANSVGLLVDNGGGTLNGNVMTWPPITIPAGGTAVKTFRVRVNSFLANGNLSMVNTFGNTVTVRIHTGQVLGAVFVAPQTGVSATLGFVFAGLITGLFAAVRIFGKKKFAAMFAKLPKIKIR